MKYFFFICYIEFETHIGSRICVGPLWSKIRSVYIGITRGHVPYFSCLQVFKKIQVELGLVHIKIHLFSSFRAFWFLKKTALCKNCISGTVTDAEFPHLRVHRSKSL